ncbi:MAG: hypothetical protein K1X79_11790 [Oligoflexia bacterium]|nr:hypothetical protein [Oligoflexia bacterium]
MKRSLMSAPESFTLAPLLALLPSRGDVSKIESLTPSLFARYEKVLAFQRECAQNPELADSSRRFFAESAMLRTVLDWLQVKPENPQEGA